MKKRIALVGATLTLLISSPAFALHYGYWHGDGGNPITAEGSVLHELLHLLSHLFGG